MSRWSREERESILDNIHIEDIFEDRLATTAQGVSTTNTKDRIQIWEFGNATPRMIPVMERNILGNTGAILFDTGDLWIDSSAKQYEEEPERWF